MLKFTTVLSLWSIIWDCCEQKIRNPFKRGTNHMITAPFLLCIVHLPKLAYHVMGQRIPSRVMPMSGKKEKSQRQIRFPYCGAVAVIWPTAEITRILGGLMNCMSAAIILTASPMLPSRIPMVWLCAISPPRPCTLYLISVKIRYKVQIKGSFPKSDFFLKVKKTPDFIRNQVFYGCGGRT